MAIEVALIKPVVDALLALFRQADDLTLKRNAEAALREVIRELLLANPDENRAEAKIAIARAAGILSEDVVLAEDMLEKHRATKARTRGKSSTGRKRAKSAATDATPAKARVAAAKSAEKSGAAKADGGPAKAAKTARKATKRTAG